MKYLTAITVPGELAETVVALQQKYRTPNWTPLIVPHITLQPPTMVPGDDSPVIDAFKRVSFLDKPFNVYLHQFGGFRHEGTHTLYVKVQPLAKLTLVREALVKQLPLLKVNPNYTFTPHITVSSGLTEKEADERSRLLMNKTLSGWFSCNHIDLYQKPDQGARWVKIAEKSLEI